jgi:sec-independent protein translocase protein TatA
MFNIGPGELVLIFAVVLLLFGAKRVPEVARSLGRSITEFKRAMNSTVSDIEDAVNSEPPKAIKPPATPVKAGSNSERVIQKKAA